MLYTFFGRNLLPPMPLCFPWLTKNIFGLTNFLCCAKHAKKENISWKTFYTETNKASSGDKVARTKFAGSVPKGRSLRSDLSSRSLVFPLAPHFLGRALGELGFL
jgi:hypothetical protein